MTNEITIIENTTGEVTTTDLGELTASQRAQAIKRRKQIWEALHPTRQRFESVYEALEPAEFQVGKVCPPEIGYGKPPPQEQGFAASTAAVSGESKRAINQHLARADALGDDLDRIGEADRA